MYCLEQIVETLMSNQVLFLPVYYPLKNNSAYYAASQLPILKICRQQN